MEDYKKISPEELETICNNGYFEEFNYVFNPINKVDILQWFGDKGEDLQGFR